MKKSEEEEFCTIFGSNPRNRIIEFFLELRELDYGIGDVARETGLNRATAYNTMEELIKAVIIIPSRKLGNTQLFKLNLKKPEVKALIKAFDYALQSVYEKHAKKELLVEA